MNKKILALLLLLFTINSLKAQTQYCEIGGVFVSTPAYKHAYLVDLKLKTILSSPIVDNHFKFIVEQPKNYQSAHLFFEVDSSKTLSYFLEKVKRVADNSRIIAIENTMIEFDGDARRVNVKEGKLNQDVEEMYSAMESNNFKVFIEKHPDSPLCLSIIKSLSVVNKMPELTEKYDCKLLFNKLSESIRNSPEGKELFLKL